MNNRALNWAYQGGRYLVAAFLLLAVVIYLLQAFSPLRINTDSYRLLSMADSAYNGGGYLVDGHPDQFPLAYPFTIKTLMQMGMATSSVLVLLNLLFLAIGLGVLYSWCRGQRELWLALLASCFVLSSWPLVKHVTLPLTDLMFLGLSLLSLWLLCQFCQRQGLGKWLWFIQAVAMGYISLMCRTTGVTLFPVMGICVLLHSDHMHLYRRLLTHRKVVITTVIVLLGVGLAVLSVVVKTQWFSRQFLDSGSYFQNMVATMRKAGVLSLLGNTLEYRVREFGEIFCNIPQSKAERLLPVLYVVGGVAWMMLLRGTWLTFRQTKLLPLPFYFLTYTAMMCLWPFYDTRFWLPLLPVMAFLLLITFKDLQQHWPKLRYLFACYLLCFFLLGLVAMGFSTRISLSGKQFSECYGDGSAKMTYRYAFDNGLPVDMREVDHRQVRLLRLLEPLAKTAEGGDTP